MSSSKPKRGGIRRGSGPRLIRRGSFTARLYRARRAIGGRPYVYFRVAYHEPGGRRVVRDFASEAEALKAAGEAAKAFALARPDALAFSSSELAEYDAARQAAEASGVGLYDAVQGYLANRAAEPEVRRTVPEVVAELIESRKANGISAVHLRDLTGRLALFAKSFPCAIGTVRPDHVRAFLKALRRDDGSPAAPRTRLNYLRLVSALFIFAGKRRYVSQERVVEIRDIERPNAAAAEDPEIFTPAEIRAILSAAPDEMVPSLAIGAFAGLRTAEIARLDWSDVRLAERVIALSATKTKTAQRRIVPIPDNLAEWLAPLCLPSGKIHPATNERTLSTRFSRTAATAGIRWKANALRHSFISYRLAITADPARVATEAGNSSAMVHANYKALVTEATGKQWFDIRPPKADPKVIPMPTTA